MPEPSLRPTSDSERLHALDAMRGVAILGVLVAYTVWSLGGPARESWSGADHAVARGMDLLVDNKFLTMFAFLFGLGIAQQWRRWQAAGHDPVPLHLRRMAFLLGIGLLHAILLRNGDILAPYAILGLVLIWFRNASNHASAVAAALLLAAPYAVKAAAPAVGLSWPERPSAAAGNYLADNVAWVRYWYETNPLLSWPGVLALMLAGLLAGRAGLIERLATRRAVAVRALAVSLLLAVLSRRTMDGLEARWTTTETLGFARSVTLSALYQVSAWTLAASYGTALLLLSQRPSWVARLWPLRALGRMAFTNYLLQALVVVPVCLAFGLFGAVTPTRGLYLALVVAVVQLWLSTWWLSRHQMGPLERVWRGVTYGSGRASLRVERPPTASGSTGAPRGREEASRRSVL